MSRKDWESVFTLVLLLGVAWAVWEARGWAIRARLFPWAIGIPLLLLLTGLLVSQVAARLKRPPAAADATPAAPPNPREAAEQAVERRRARSIVGWLAGFLGAIWLLGFPLGGTLATLAYLRLCAREKWPISLAISVGTALFFVLMINGLNTPFPRGTLFEVLAPVG